jgi:hypothetical protein
VAAVARARRPKVAGPGLAGGLFVAAVWLAVSGWTFGRFLAPVLATGARPLLLIAVPSAVGAGATLRGGSAAVGKHAARLAAVSAGLGLYLYGLLAVAAVGAGGPPGLPGATVAGNVSDRLGNQVILGLIVLPLATATVGWAAAAATARLRWGVAAQALPAGPGSAPAAVRDLPGLGTSPGTGPEPGAAAAPFSQALFRAVSRERARARYRLLLAAIVAAAVVLALIAWLPGR